MPKNQKKTTMTPAQKIGVGVGLTAAAVTAAGAYFLYGSKNAAKNRKTVKSWSLKAKAEVLEKLEMAKEMSKEEYEDLINNVAEIYTGVKSASKVDIKAFKEEMKDHWKAIERTALPKKKVVKKAVKAVVKKAPAKKVVAKAKTVAKK
jgi:6-phosphogluconolactonase (cycloisomerase 2 family)